MTLASGGGSSPSATWEANISFTQGCVHQHDQQVRPISMTGDFPTCGFFMVQWLQFGLYRIYLQLQQLVRQKISTNLSTSKGWQVCKSPTVPGTPHPMEERSSTARQPWEKWWLTSFTKTAEGLTPLPSWTDGKTGFAWGYATNKDHGTGLDTDQYWKMTPTHSSLPTLLRSPYPTPNTPTQIPTASALPTKPGCLGRCGSHQCPRVGDVVWCFDGCRVASRSAAFIAPSKAMEEPTAMPRTPPPDKNGDEKQISFRSNQQKSMNFSKNWLKLGNGIHLKGSAAMICQGGYNKA